MNPRDDTTTVSALAPEVPFAEPWQAQAFGLVVHLHEQGLFSWPEWAETLSAQRAAADAREDGTDYFQHWVAALQVMLERLDVADGTELDAITEAWQRAAHATPHGQAIMLSNDPLPTREVLRMLEDTIT